MLDQYKPEWDSDFDLPYFYVQFQEKIIGNRLLKENLRSFKLIATKEPCIIRKGELKDLSLQNSVFLRNSRELLEGSQRASERIRPILAYYAHQQYACFFIYTLLKYPKTTVSRGHGLSIEWGEGNDTDISSIRVVFNKTGFFPRLVDTFTVLGHSNAYSQWLALQRNDHKFDFVENTLDSRIKIGKTDLLSMMNFDSSTFNQEFRSHFPEPSYLGYSESYDKLLTDLVLLFVASDIARYRPQLWERILEGDSENEARFNKRMKSVYDTISITEKSNYYQTFHYQVWAEFSRLSRWQFS